MYRYILRAQPAPSVDRLKRTVLATGPKEAFSHERRCLAERL